MTKYILVLLLSIISVAGLRAENNVKFIAELPSPNEYDIFANGGWNGNWYIGKNHSWVSKLGPVPDVSDYDKIYLGARIGRAKTQKQIDLLKVSTETIKNEGKEKEHSIYIGVSESTSRRPQGKRLVNNIDIPLEGSDTVALNGIFASRWFWIEIDRSWINISTDNYVHLWTDSEDLNSVLTAPILAAGIGSNKLGNSYLIEGVENSAIKTISYFEPAIAIKLVKKAAAASIKLLDLKSHPFDMNKYVVEVNVSGTNIISMGMQIYKNNNWENIGREQSEAPYTNLLNIEKLPVGKYKLRCWVKNWAERISYSSPRSFKIDNKKQ